MASLLAIYGKISICKIKTIVEAVLYGVPSVSKILANAILVYLPLIYKYDTDLAKYLPDLYI